MGKTDDFQDFVIARWCPGEQFSVREMYALSEQYGFATVESTIRRTMQELRDRGVIRFTDNDGNYERLPVRNESYDSKESWISCAERLRSTSHSSVVKLLAVEKILKLKSRSSPIYEDIEAIVGLKVTECETSIKARIGQGEFRQKLIGFWGGKCAVSNCDVVSILRASHIKPWRKSSGTERLDVFNGLLLLPSYDALFDQGFITFEEDGAILIWSGLEGDVLNQLGVSRGASLRQVNHEHLPYLQFHREHEFLGSL